MAEGVQPVGEQRRWFVPGVRAIGLASFLSDLGHEVPTALLPSLLTTTLGLGADRAAATLGAIEGVADGAAGVARLGGGPLADDPHRRRATAVGGYAMTAVFSSLIAATTAAWQVGVLRAVAWGARGARSPSRNALLADLVPASAYGRAYGFERAMDNLGAIGGPLLALGLVALVGVRAAIALSFIPAALAAVAIVVAVRSAPTLGARERRPLRIHVRSVLHGRLRGLVAGIAAFELANVAATLLILRALNLLSPGESYSATALVLYAGYNLAATLIAVPGGVVTDRRGPDAVLVAGAVAFAAAFTGFAFVGASVGALAACFVVAGAGIGLAESAQSAAVATHAPVELRGSAFGLVAGVQAFANLAASAVAGLLYATVSPRAAFLYLAGWAALSAGLFCVTLVRRREGH
ncbi:MAG: MFS transporter [Actinomycetes bacterium]